MTAKYDFRWDKHAHIRMSSRSLGKRHSLYFAQLPWTPPTTNMEGLVSYFPPERVAAARKRLKRVNKKRYLRDILEHLLRGGVTHKELVAGICGFVSDAMYYNPIQQAQENHTGNLIMDPVELLELHDGRCGQGVAVTLALLETAGIECRKRPVFHHVTCEARYEGRWHLADALMFGANQPERDGEVVSVAQLRREPYFADAFPLRCFVYTPEEVLSQDGYRLLGYCYGEWGSLPYYSWYMGAEEEYPPFTPIVLPVERLSHETVRLRWAPSSKRNGGAVRYRVAVYEDRGRTRPLFRRTIPSTSLKWRVPETMHMYFIGVTAIDDHIRKNPATWYPEAVGNFVLTDPAQYGWYGVV